MKYGCTTWIPRGGCHKKWNTSIVSRCLARAGLRGGVLCSCQVMGLDELKKVANYSTNVGTEFLEKDAVADR